MKKMIFVLIGLLFFSSFESHAFLSETDDAHPFNLSFEDAEPVEVKDFQAQFDFLFQIPEKHKLYKDKIWVEVDNKEIHSILVKPAGIMMYDDFMEEETEIYHDQLAVLLKIRFPKNYDFNENVTGKIFYQGCSDKICFRTVSQAFELRLAPDQQTLSQMRQVAPSSQPSFWDLFKTNDFRKILAQGWFVAILISFLAGLLTGFTPCVLPVIPLTLTFIGVTSKESHTTRIKNLLIFVFGLVLMYTALGIFSALLGQSLGFVFQNTYFLVFLVVFFFVMSLWMFGVFNFGLPSRFQNAIVKFQPKGHFKYFYSGLTIGFLAAPCVGPVLGPLLVYISSSQNVFYGSALMLSYSIGLSVMFFVLGFFSRNWLSRFSEKTQWVKRAFGVLLMLVSVFYAMILVKPFFHGPLKTDHFFKTPWVEALNEAPGEEKGVLIDFFADWCLPCHEWDQDVWSDRLVQEKVNEKFIPVKIDCTVQTRICTEAIERYDVVGWPSILFLDQNGNEILDKRLVGIVMDPVEFLKYVDEIETDATQN